MVISIFPLRSGLVSRIWAPSKAVKVTVSRFTARRSSCRESTQKGDTPACRSISVSGCFQTGASPPQAGEHVVRKP